MRYSMIYYDNELLLIFSFVDQLGRYRIFYWYFIVELTKIPSSIYIRNTLNYENNWNIITSIKNNINVQSLDNAWLEGFTDAEGSSMST